MLSVYDANGVVTNEYADAECLRAALWIDLLNPQPDQVAAVERALDLRLPTRSQAQEIEVSSRLYIQDHAVFMTATVLVGARTEHLETTTVTFVFQRARLVTLRFAEPMSFSIFIPKFQQNFSNYPTAEKVLMGLLDEIVDRLADTMEMVSAEMTTVSQTVFRGAGADGPRFTQGERYARVNYTMVLNQIGLNGERTASVRESLVTLGRMLVFINEVGAGRTDAPLDEHWRTLRRDVTALTDHATFLSDKVAFALDATLGRINNEQNMIIKLFSVLSVVLLPPTLIASIYGMNFEFMPELTWRYGYPYALALMAISAVMPYIFFKRKGWL
ncbi:MAG: Magnesium transport protein CorA [Anaerolineae bacterium]|nr:Magnesium transport protein CorA [Anaerolineae bacterium]